MTNFCKSINFWYYHPFDVFLATPFWTKNTRNLIKGSTDCNSSLVSNKTLSEILPSNGWAQGQVTWAKMTKNLLHLQHQPQKNEIHNLVTFFFHCKLEGFERVFWGFEKHTNTIDWRVMELQKLGQIIPFSITWPAPNVLSHLQMYTNQVFISGQKRSLQLTRRKYIWIQNYFTTTLYSCNSLPAHKHLTPSLPVVFGGDIQVSSVS